MSQTSPQSSEELIAAQQTLWNRRYKNEGQIWGDEPSPAALTLLERINRTSASILEIGFGYGRDMHEFACSNHSVTGVELSVAGLEVAMNDNNPLSGYFKSGKVQFHIGNFTNAHLGQGEFDAVFSHRTLHLLGNNGLVRAFARQAARVVKAPHGLLVVSARDTRDFDPDQMVMRQDGFAEYKPEVEGRQGQLISLWDEARFKSVFGKKFDIKDIIQAEEQEAISNPGKKAKFTIMVAERKPL